MTDDNVKYPDLRATFDHPVREVPSDSIPAELAQVLRALARVRGYDDPTPIVVRAGRGEGGDHTEIQSFFKKAERP